MTALHSALKPNFAGGELSPSMYGRVDLAKYQVGVATMRNFFVDTRGPAFSRAGTEIVGMPAIALDDPKPRLIPFIFNAEQAYELELHAGRMRVIYRGDYVTHDSVNITGASTGLSTVLTIPGHAFATGDFVVVADAVGLTRTNGISGVNGRQFYISASSPTTITLADVGPLGGPDYVDVPSTTWAAWVSGGTVSRIYSVAIPWASDALFALNYAQNADVMTVVHPDYPITDIRRLAQDDWQVVQAQFGATVGAPTSGSVVDIPGTGTGSSYFYAYAVTTIDEDGRESTPLLLYGSNYALNHTAPSPTFNQVTFTGVAGAYRYRIYKANPVPSGYASPGPYVYGLIGETVNVPFSDMNYAPDFAEGPPEGRNPFFNQSIAAAIITSPGSGYVSPQLVITDGTGSAASIALVADTSLTASPYGRISAANVVAGGDNYTAPVGTVVDTAPLGTGLLLAFDGTWIANPLGTGFVPAPGSITILNGGSNYHQGSYANFVQAEAGNQVGTNVLNIDVTSVEFGAVTGISYAPADITPVNTTGLSSTGTGDTIAFTVVGTDTPGSGAVVTLTLGGTTNPSCVAYFEQRKVYGGSRAFPTRLWLSRVGQFYNFDVSDPIQDDDAITATVNAQEVNIINGLVPVTNGLMVLTSGGAYLVNGGANDAPVTPSSIRAVPQAFSGAQALAPLRMADHVLYAQARGQAVRDLAYNLYSNNFTGTDISVLSNHLLEGRQITQWTFAEEPHKVLWAVRDDGVMLSLTYLKEQEVFGWARHDTTGEFVSVSSIPEGREDAVYVVTRRYRPGYGFHYYTERMASRLFGANPAANIPSAPELSWCVDAGARYDLTYPGTAMLYGALVERGVISSVSVAVGGTGYSGTLNVQIQDLAGSGASITATQSGGVINSVTLVDGGANYVNPQVTIAGAGGGSGATLVIEVQTTFLLTFAASAFTAGDIGKVLRVRGGRGTVIDVPNPNQLLVNFIDQVPAPLPNISDIVLPYAPPGEWSLTEPVSVVGGLDHLNGATVQVLVDGNHQDPKVVVDGCVTLDNAGTMITIGQGYTAQLGLLSMETKQPTSQGQFKNIVPITLRVRDTRGVAFGTAWDALTEVPERTIMPMGVPLPFQQGGGFPLDPLFEGAPVGINPLYYNDQFINAPARWTEVGVLCLQQSYPLPAAVLGFWPMVLDSDK
jgi:hypothetical protein